MALNVRLDFIKDELLDNVSTAIKQLQMDSCQSSNQEAVHFTGNMWQVQDLCFQLDCILNHGLKQRSGGYWPFLKEITHKSTADFILSFPRAVSNAVRGWAWLFVALNECAVESYLRSLSTHPRILDRHYLPDALLRDPPRLQVLVMMVAGLEHLTFELEPESACLRSWKSAISEIKYESCDVGDAEEAECASLASYDSGEMPGIHEADPEVAVVRVVSSSRLASDSPSLCGDTEQEDESDVDIVHSYTRATRRRRKERPSSTNSNMDSGSIITTTYNNNVYNCKDELDTKQLLLNRVSDSETMLDNNNTTTTPSDVGTKESFVAAITQLSSETTINGCVRSLDNPDTVFLVSESTPNTTQTINNGGTAESNDSFDRSDQQPSPNAENSSSSSVKLRHRSNLTDGCASSNSREKRVSFDAENLVRTLEINSRSSIVDIPWDTLNGSTLGTVMSLYERGAPEGQEADPMTSSVTSSVVSVAKVSPVMLDDVSSSVGNVVKPVVLTRPLGGWKNGSASMPLIESMELVDRSVMETSSRAVSAEIASELHLALESAKRRLVEGEVPLENNFHLMIMLEVIVDQQEKVYKVFRATIGHTVGSPADVFLILTDQRFYIAHWDEETKHYVVNASFHFLEIEFLQLSLNYQIINIVCALPRQRHWICTGNEEITRNIVTSLDVAIRRNSKVKNPPCIFTDLTCHSLGIQKWVARTTKRETKDTKVDHYCLVWWEDPHNAPDALNPLGPSIEGHLMYRYVGRSVFKKQNWSAGFFRLKAGVLYQSEDAIDRNFKSYVKLIGGECTGCRRTPDNDRPHSFELVLPDNRSLQLAAPSETDSSDWLQALLQTVSSVHCEDSFASFRTPACLILAAQKLFVCHEELETSTLKSLGRADVQDVSAVHLDPQDAPFCILEFESVEATQSSGDWLLYFQSRLELSKFVDTLDQTWHELYKIPMSRIIMDDPIMVKRCRMQSKLLCRWEKTPHTP